MQRPLPRFGSEEFFCKRDIRRNVLPQFIGICMETPCLCPPWRTATNRNISNRVLLQNREFSPQGTYKH